MGGRGRINIAAFDLLIVFFPSVEVPWTVSHWNMKLQPKLQLEAIQLKLIEAQYKG
jgi:hypothetical protein